MSVFNHIELDCKHRLTLKSKHFSVNQHCSCLQTHVTIALTFKAYWWMQQVILKSLTSFLLYCSILYWATAKFVTNIRFYKMYVNLSKNWFMQETVKHHVYRLHNFLLLFTYRKSLNQINEFFTALALQKYA